MFQKINDFLSSRKNSKLINEISNKYLQKVNSFEDELRSLSQDDLINKIYDLKKSYSENKIQELKELGLVNPTLTDDELTRLKEGNVKEPTGQFKKD